MLCYSIKEINKKFNDKFEYKKMKRPKNIESKLPLSSI